MSTSRRQVRTLAMQALYQLEARGGEDYEAAAAMVLAEESPGDAEGKGEALRMVREAWAARERADALVAELAPDWPTHRQPLVDRSILRLACWELEAGEVPPAVAIDEAVELGKAFGTERSAAFINGVLDKIAKRRDAEQPPAPPMIETDGPAPAPPESPLAIRLPSPGRDDDDND